MTTPIHTNEKDLLERLREGDETAFEHLYNHYKKHITGHLLHLFRSTELSQEIAQDTFVTVWEHREQINPEKSFKAYLFAIATNKAYNLFRRAAHDEKLRAYLHPVIEQGINQVEDYIFRRENEVLLKTLLDRMPERQREVFRLAKIEGLSYEKIALQLDISHNTINTHIKRASAFLIQQFANHPELFAFIILSVLEVERVAS